MSSASPQYRASWQPTARRVGDVVIADIRQTCAKCPSQWEGRLVDGRSFYIRYRHGYLSVSIGPAGGTIEQAIDAPDWFGEQIGGALDGSIKLYAVCARTGLELAGPPQTPSVQF